MKGVALMLFVTVAVSSFVLGLIIGSLAPSIVEITFDEEEE